MRINKKQKHFIFAYIFIVSLLFITVSWNYISFAFNYRQVSNLVSNAFVDNSVYANNEPDFSGHSDSIEIPALDIFIPVIQAKSANIDILEQDLDQGVVIYPGSSLPGKSGQTVVLGHSAPLNWPRIKYDWAFSNIGDLILGDKVIFYFNGKQYKYRVSQKIILQKGQDIPVEYNDKNSNVLIMISCWPPGQDYKRIAVRAEIIK